MKSLKNPKVFLVQITVDDPYPKKFEARVEASNISRALYLGSMRIRKQHFFRRSVKEMRITARLIANEKNES